MKEHGVESFLAGFFLGGIIGAGIALLFAPASGAETREQIARQANRVFEEGKEGADYVRRLVQEEIAGVRDSADAVREAVNKGVDEFKKHKG